jgi:hypothetical protein
MREVEPVRKEDVKPLNEIVVMHTSSELSGSRHAKYSLTVLQTIRYIFPAWNLARYMPYTNG